MTRRRSFLVSTLGTAVTLALTSPGPAAAQSGALVGLLPASVDRALRSASLPRDALGTLVVEVNSSAPRLAWQATKPMNPASLTKLFTTYIGLDLLGPAYTWNTPVWVQGDLVDGVLNGNVTIKGTGDPKLVMERVWLLLRRVRQLGIQEIRGDLVLDRSAFSVPEQAPGAFDNEPLKPYNAQADALLLNQRAILLTLTPMPDRRVALVSSDPPLADTRITREVPLSTGPCDDYRGSLQADFTEPGRIRFAGSYPLACGEKVWPLADPDPSSFNARLLERMWRDVGGKLGGQVREGVAPANLAPTFQLASPPLPEVIRDINKYSNNVMAQQLFLTLAYAQRGVGTVEGAREVVTQWVTTHFGDAAKGFVIDNGSGLSRDTRISPLLFARLLKEAWNGPMMSELMSSLPVSGVDGTMRRSHSPAGRAHLKTGSLRDVSGVAGYVLAPSGKRYIVVAIVNNPSAGSGAARPVLDAVVNWALNDGAD